MLSQRQLWENEYGGLHVNGEAFNDLKWLEVMLMYEQINEKEGDCSVRILSRECRISLGSANKAITCYNAGLVAAEMKRGHGREGVGSIHALENKHHLYIYELFLENPSRPRLGYVKKLKKKHRIAVDESFITNWFKTIGPFKGSMRVTSSFPLNKDSPHVMSLLQQHVGFIQSLKDHRRLIFTDEKPFKGKDIFDTVRRDPFTGLIPTLNTKEANSRKRHNCFTAIALKKECPSYSLVLEENGDSSLFFQFTTKLVEIGMLEKVTFASPTIAPFILNKNVRNFSNHYGTHAVF